MVGSGTGSPVSLKPKDQFADGKYWVDTILLFAGGSSGHVR